MLLQGRTDHTRCEHVPIATTTCPSLSLLPFPSVISSLFVPLVAIFLLSGGETTREPMRALLWVKMSWAAHLQSQQRLLLFFPIIFSLFPNHLSPFLPFFFPVSLSKSLHIHLTTSLSISPLISILYPSSLSLSVQVVISVGILLPVYLAYFLVAVWFFIQFFMETALLFFTGGRLYRNVSQEAFTFFFFLLSAWSSSSLSSTSSSLVIFPPHPHPSLLSSFKNPLKVRNNSSVVCVHSLNVPEMTAMLATFSACSRSKGQSL